MSYLLPIFFMSLVGSPHCVAMCGGFATLGASGSRSFVGVSLYHGGRLVTYLTGGFLAYLLGSALTKSAAVLGLQSGAQYIIGLALVAWGVALLSPHVRRARSLARLHSWMGSIYGRFIGVFPQNSRLFPFALGIGSTLLPCGWLYLYVITAAQSSQPLLVMGVFWLGTLPLLTVWGALSGRLLSKLGRHFPLVRSLCLVASGLISLAQHSSVRGEAGPDLPQCHSAAAVVE